MAFWEGWEFLETLPGRSEAEGTKKASKTLIHSPNIQRVHRKRRLGSPDCTYLVLHSAMPQAASQAATQAHDVLSTRSRVPAWRSSQRRLPPPSCAAQTHSQPTRMDAATLRVMHMQLLCQQCGPSSHSLAPAELRRPACGAFSSLRRKCTFSAASAPPLGPLLRLQSQYCHTAQ